MEETKGLSDGVSDIELFINSQPQLSIPEATLKRFVFDVQHEDYWYKSDKVYDEWFHKYYPRYDKFIEGLKKELLEDADYKLVPLISGARRMNEKIVYLVSYQGLTRLEMKKDA
jgi:hypothetical protein